MKAQIGMKQNERLHGILSRFNILGGNEPQNSVSAHVLGVAVSSYFVIFSIWQI